MNHYLTSTGERISKTAIDRKVRQAKEQKLTEQKDEYGYNFCEECMKSAGTYLDCSHNISVDRCQKDRKTELAWDITNITIRCRDCHNKHDKL